MILVDTSVWVSHLKAGEGRLRGLLTDGKVLCHPFVVGELACGNIKNRREILSLLQLLPMAKTASDEEVLHFIDRQNLMGIGLGLVDVHLLASALLSKASLWTLDKQLEAARIKLQIDHK
ncbi:MAG TPA: PIN domain-containing protein [Dehalococcoidia bacterium]|nr:PIN domain-containing protein [Dehalococcoidia bacterium]